MLIWSQDTLGRTSLGSVRKSAPILPHPPKNQALDYERLEASLKAILEADARVLKEASRRTFTIPPPWRGDVSYADDLEAHRAETRLGFWARWKLRWREYRNRRPHA